jgi:hypothetical protein
MVNGSLIIHALSKGFLVLIFARMRGCHRLSKFSTTGKSGQHWHTAIFSYLRRYRPLSQVGSRRKRCPGQFGQDGMGSIPATPSTKHASCFPPSSMPASIEISIKLIVCLFIFDAGTEQGMHQG